MLTFARQSTLPLPQYQIAYIQSEKTARLAIRNPRSAQT